MSGFGRCPSCGAGSPSGTTRDPDGFITCGGCRQVAQSGLWGVAPAEAPGPTATELLESHIRAANAVIENQEQQLDAANTRIIELRSEVDALKSMIIDLQRHAV
jgi:hypothetical protein